MRRRRLLAEMVIHLVAVFQRERLRFLALRNE